MNNMKRQKYMTLKGEFPRSIGAQYSTGEEWRIASERMKRLSQSENNTQLWMSLMMEVKCDAIKNNIAQKKPGMLSPWIKVNWKWSNRRWQE